MSLLTVASGVREEWGCYAREASITLLLVHFNVLKAHVNELELTVGIEFFHKHNLKFNLFIRISF